MYSPRASRTSPCSSSTSVRTCSYRKPSTEASARCTEASAGPYSPAARRALACASSERAAATASASSASGAGIPDFSASMSRHLEIRGRSARTSCARSTTSGVAALSTVATASRPCRARCKHAIRRSSTAIDCSPDRRVASQASVCIDTQSSAHACSSNVERFDTFGAYVTPVASRPALTSARRCSFHTCASSAPAREQSCASYRHHTMPVAALAARTVAATSCHARRRDRSRDIAPNSASIVGHRSLGSTLSPRSSTRRSHSGTERPGGGGRSSPCVTAKQSSPTLLPPNGRCPYKASHNATQSPNWSVRSSNVLPSNCSGAMYAGVPATVPGDVSSSLPVASRRGETTLSPSSGVGVSVRWVASVRASPKSMTRTRRRVDTLARFAPELTDSIMRLSGFTSRCSSPWACAAASPRAACLNTRTTSRQDRCPSASHCVTVCPSTNSIATNTRSSTTPTSCTPTTLGWLSFASASASRLNRADAAGPPPCDKRTLTATLRSSSGSYAA